MINSDRHVYRVSKEYIKVAIAGVFISNIFIMVGIIFSFSLWFSSGEISNLIISIVLMLVILYNIAHFIDWSRNTWMIISNIGLEYSTPGMKIRSDWMNIKSLDKSSRKFQLILVKPSALYMSPLMSFWKATTTANRNVDRSIPLYIFSDKFLQCEMYQRIIKYLPDNFEIENDTSPH